MKHLLGFLGGSTIALLSACGGGTAAQTNDAGAAAADDAGAAAADDAGDSAPAVPTVGCAGWTVVRSQGSASTATIANGALTLARPASPKSDHPSFNGADLALVQSGLTGDFDVAVQWEAFHGTSVSLQGPAAQVGVWMSNGGMSSQATGEVGRGSGWATVSHGSQLTENALSSVPPAIDGSSGSFRIRRVGGHVTVTTVVSGATAVAESTGDFSDSPLALFIAIGDDYAHGADTGAASIRIKRVTVTGGGGAVKSDDFTCPQ